MPLKTIVDLREYYNRDDVLKTFSEEQYKEFREELNKTCNSFIEAYESAALESGESNILNQQYICELRAFE